MEKCVVVSNSFQKNYTYYLTEPEGKNFDLDFKPELTPKEMLELGVFGGHYFSVETTEFPQNWFTNAKLSPDKKDKSFNFFKVSASQPLLFWKKKGWINKQDPQGWFQWYCRVTS